MDPNETLERLRMAVRAFRACNDEFDRHWDHPETLVDAAEALDEWLSKGGFLPEAWQDLRRK